MKKLLRTCLAAMLLLMAVSVLPAPARAAEIAASGTCEPINYDNGTRTDAVWTLDTDGVLTFTGTGWLVDGEWRDYQDQVTRLVLSEGIVGMDNCLFQGFTALVSAELPDSLANLGTYTFADCTALTQVRLPQGLQSIGSYSFNGCSALTAIDLPETVTVIGYDAFENCTSLSDITLPEGVTAILSSAFQGCTALTRLTLPEGLTQLGGYAFYGSGLTQVRVPGGVKTVEFGAFWNCDSLQSAVLCEGVTALGDYCFNDCDSLQSLWLPDSLTTFGQWMFANCASLAEVRLPQTMTKIPDSFLYGTAITSLVVPEGVTELETNAFGSCYQLREITLPSTLKTIGGWAFSGCEKLREIVLPQGLEVIDYRAFANCAGLTRLELPEGLTTIGEEAFIACRGLESLTLPDSLTSLGMLAFCECSGLRELTLPAGLTVIPIQVFQNCDSLERLVIPEGVTKIDMYAFGGCRWLRELSLPSTLTVIETGAFARCSALGHAEVPEGVTYIGQYAFSGEHLTFISLPEGAELDGDIVRTDACELIYGTTGSAAHHYAVENGINFVDPALGEDIASGVTDSGAHWKITALGTLMVWGDEAMWPVTITQREPWAAYRWAIRNVVLDLPVDRIDNYAFEDYHSLQAVRLPEGLTRLGRSAFGYCWNLQSINLPSTLREMGTSAFSYCTLLDHVTIPGAVTVVDQETFLECRSLTHLVIGRGVQTIKSGAFAYTNLESIVIPATVTEIESYVFQNNRYLRYAEIPASVTAVGRGTFANCTDLETLVIRGTPTLGDYLFDNTHNPNHALRVYYRSDLAWSDAGRPYNGNPLWLDITGRVDLSDQLVESEHDYANNLDTTWEITSPGAQAITITFDEDTYFARNDVLYVNGTAYTGDSLAGETLTLPGEVITLRLVTNATGTDYGFALTECYVVNHACARRLQAVSTCQQGGWGVDGCVLCGADTTEYWLPTLPERWTDDVVLEEPGYLTDGEQVRVCMVCGEKVYETLPSVMLGVGSWGSLDWTLNREGVLEINGTRSDMADFGADFTQGWRSFAPQITRVVVNRTVRGIGANAFAGCGNLTEVVLRSSVLTIGENAFAGCTGLTAVELPENLESIAAGAFAGCTGLAEITFTGAVPEIAENAFAGVTAEVTFPEEEPDWLCDVCLDYGGSLTWQNVVHREGTADFGAEDGLVVAYCEHCGRELYRCLPGDMDGSGAVDSDDALQLLYSLFYGDATLNQPADVNGDGTVDTRDAVYLLYHYYFGEAYPIVLPGCAGRQPGNDVFRCAEHDIPCGMMFACGE